MLVAIWARDFLHNGLTAESASHHFYVLYMILKSFTVAEKSQRESRTLHVLGHEDLRIQKMTNMVRSTLRGQAIMQNVSTPDRDFQFRLKSLSFDHFRGMDSVRVI